MSGAPTAGGGGSGRGAPAGRAADGLTLALDASTPRGSVAVVHAGRVVAEETVLMRSATEERLLPAVAAALAGAGAGPVDVARLVCGAGPGSFTGLRIAAATAKGLAQALAVPVHAVSSLALIAAAAEPPLAPGGYLAVLDALRGERFVLALQVTADGVPAARGPVRLLLEAAVAAVAAAEGLVRVGPGEERALWPHARGVARLEPALADGGPVSLAGWEPDYGRLAEAQVKWEAAHRHALPTG